VKAKAFAEEHLRSEKVGMDDFVAEPIDAVAIVAALLFFWLELGRAQALSLQSFAVIAGLR
jgi:hypothetical protein